jgi:hypothetical protein
LGLIKYNFSKLKEIKDASPKILRLRIFDGLKLVVSLIFCAGKNEAGIAKTTIKIIVFILGNIKVIHFIFILFKTNFK